MTKETGGPAFPGIKETGSSGCYSQVPYEGMTLRDWLAGMAMANIAARAESIVTYEEMAEKCYIQADAMLKAREQ